MLIYRRTSLLESPAQTLVNTVNCVGVMGKGLAKAFKEREPLMFLKYKDLCSSKQLAPGTLWLWRGTSNWTLNFPTKNHWRQPSRLEWIEAGLEKFVDSYKDQGIREISFPRLGCGNGNLDWKDVQPVMEHYLHKVDIPVYIHDFSKDIGLPEHLEVISNKLSRDRRQDISFETFISFLSQITSLSENLQIESLTDRNLFTVRMDCDSSLLVETDDATWSYDMEDLHGAWVALLRGLVTREKVEWSHNGGGNCVITLLSLLPNTRPIEIQRGDYLEIAVELKPTARNVMMAGDSGKQLALAWH